MPHDLAAYFQRRRDRRFLLKFFLAMSLLALLPLGIARWQENRRRNAPKTPYTFPFAEMAALDRVVQARFAVVPDKDFGIDRIGKRHEVFVPQTAKEKAVIAALKKRGYEVVFYVAGRNYLRDVPGRLGWNFLQGPIFITDKTPVKGQQTPYSFIDPNGPSFQPNPVPAGLPEGGKLVEPSPLKASARKALESFETSEGMDFSMAGWQIAARPVRASQQACVDCHNRQLVGDKFYHWRNHLDFELGDTIGVAMYAYRQKAKKP